MFLALFSSGGSQGSAEILGEWTCEARFTRTAEVVTHQLDVVYSPGGQGQYSGTLGVGLGMHFSKDERARSGFNQFNVSGEIIHHIEKGKLCTKYTISRLTGRDERAIELEDSIKRHSDVYLNTRKTCQDYKVEGGKLIVEGAGGQTVCVRPKG